MARRGGAGKLNSVWSEFSYNVEEDTLIVEREVSQVVGESAEIVSEADLEVVTDVPVDGGKSAIVRGVCVGHMEGAAFQKQVPPLHHVQISAYDAEMGG